MTSLQVGDFVHVVSGRSTGQIESIDYALETANVYWGVLDGQRVTKTHALADLFKSDYKPPVPPKNDSERREALPALRKEKNPQADLQEGYGG